jgi:3-dehydroquinate synthase
MKTLRVHLGPRSYPIIVGKDILPDLPSFLAERGLPASIAVVTDARVARLHAAPLVALLRRSGCRVTELVLAPGERQKSLANAERIITHLLTEKHTRRSALLAFGGGVVGDVAGFAAATFRRGIPLIQVPTTLLAQVESAIGGKTAVNHALSKNAIGAFHQPSLVVSDVALLATLPKREIICGLGEIVKYGMINKQIFTVLDRRLEDILAGDPAALQEIILRCNAVKAALIRDDEREELPSGGRAVLNLGHTVGHALEDLSRYRLRHGEAVVVGLRWELRIALAAGIISARDAARFEGLLARIPFHPPLDAIPRERIVERVVAHSASAGMVVPRAPGSILVTRDIPAAVIRRVSRAFRP